MVFKVLCVAEKPSIAKAVAGHLSGGIFQTRHVTGAQYTKNYEFDFDFGPPWGNCKVTMTSVLGHLTDMDFGAETKDWYHPPPYSLFDANVHVKVYHDKIAIAKNIETQAKFCKALFIWTDCDREGEYIGNEVREQAVKGNPRIEVKRAMFNNIERAHVINAAKNPVNLDGRQVDAVAARIELDLRIGYAFTRFQTNALRSLGGPLAEATLSYGSCQFPTLGFVVDRYLKVRNFVPEPFWSMKVTHTRDNIDVTFLWNRNRLFDRAAVIILFERCLEARIAKVSKVQQKPTKRWKPLPLTTVEMQKMASRMLGMNSQTAMKVAEELYNQGFISYPRTETDIFDKGMNLKALVEKHTQDARWGQFAQNLVNGAFKWPRAGRHDDKAHPPIHPIASFVGDRTSDKGRLYEFVVRRFLACCSEDAIGTATDIELQYGPENFHAHGVIVLERNYLDVYPYENWTGNMLPKFTLGEQFEPKGAMITDGKTASPGYLTEPDLIALMDANGIGTDATMSEHIAKIKTRAYVMTQSRGAGAAPVEDDNPPARGGRGGARGGGRGRGRGRGGAAAATGRGGGAGLEEFIPTTLGVALIEGYDNIGFEEKLSKPFLRKELELQLKSICDGTKTKNEVMRTEVGRYKRVYRHTEDEIGVLRQACRRYIFNNNGVAA